jgi:hypothetical protein
MNWDEMLEDEFDLKLPPAKATRWWDTLRENFYQLSSDEIGLAIADASGRQDPDKRRVRPTLGDVRCWIAKRRKGARGSSSITSYEGRINFIRAKLRDADPDNELMWDIICAADRLFPDVITEPLSNHDCEGLEEWSVLELDFKRPTWESISGGVDLTERMDAAVVAMKKRAKETRLETKEEALSRFRDQQKGKAVNV